MPAVVPSVLEPLLARAAASTGSNSSRLEPNITQRNTIIVACAYVAIIIILWNVPILNYIIYPFKLLTVGMHEFSHALLGLLTGAKIESITLDPDEGGATRMRGGIPWITLPAGYLGSSLIGAIFIACGFDEKASKIASIVLAFFFLVTLWWARRNWLTWVIIVGVAGLIVLFWFVAHGTVLRYLVLFIGVMSCLYSVWDIVDDLIRRKVNTSDASQFAHVIGCCPPQVWGVVWLFISLGFFALGIIVGILAFKDSASQQQQENQSFLPTR